MCVQHLLKWTVESRQSKAQKEHSHDPVIAEYKRLAHDDELQASWASEPRPAS